MARKDVVKDLDKFLYIDLFWKNERMVPSLSRDQH